MFHKLQFDVHDEKFSILPVRTETQSKSTLVKFTKPKLSRKVFELRKSITVLNTKHFGIDGEKKRIYINKDLPKTTRDLLRKVRVMKNVEYRYLWCKNGKVFTRRHEERI